jgi:chromosome segregation ATPase
MAAAGKGGARSPASPAHLRAERKTTESEGGRPAGALEQARMDLDERKTRLKELEAKIAEKVDRLEVAKTKEERESIKESITKLEEQQDRVEKQIEKLRAEIRELGELESGPSAQRKRSKRSARRNGRPLNLLHRSGASAPVVR